MSQDPFEALEAALGLYGERAATAFCATLSTRMLHNYMLYCEATGSGEPERAHAIMALVWEALLTPASRIDFGLQAEKLAPLEQALEAADTSFGGMLSQHALMALGICLETLSSKREGAAVEISRLSRHDVEEYIELSGEADEVESGTHPLWLDEEAFQQEVVTRLQQGCGKEVLRGLKQLGHNDGVSNIGIATREKSVHTDTGRRRNDHARWPRQPRHGCDRMAQSP